MWLKESVKFALFTVLGILPLIVFLDFGAGIMIFRDLGLIQGALLIMCVVFYAEFCKKYRDT